MVVRLSAEELGLVRALREFGALEAIEGHKVPDSERVLICMCGDGHQAEDFLTHNGHCGCGSLVRHLVAVNGGATRIRANGEVETEYLLGQIAGARELKQINTIILEAHAPCGMAIRDGLDVRGVFQALLGAKQIVREANQEANQKAVVIAFFHIAYYDDLNEVVRRTYFVNGKKMRAFFAKNHK